MLEINKFFTKSLITLFVFSLLSVSACATDSVENGADKVNGKKEYVPRLGETKKYSEYLVTARR